MWGRVVGEDYYCKYIYVQCRKVKPKSIWNFPWEIESHRGGCAICIHYGASSGSPGTNSSLFERISGISYYQSKRSHSQKKANKGQIWQGRERSFSGKGNLNLSTSVEVLGYRWTNELSKRKNRETGRTDESTNGIIIGNTKHLYVRRHQSTYSLSPSTSFNY